MKHVRSRGVFYVNFSAIYNLTIYIEIVRPMSGNTGDHLEWTGTNVRDIF